MGFIGECIVFRAFFRNAANVGGSGDLPNDPGIFLGRRSVEAERISNDRALSVPDCTWGSNRTALEGSYFHALQADTLFAVVLSQE